MPVVMYPPTEPIAFERETVTESAAGADLVRQFEEYRNEYLRSEFGRRRQIFEQSTRRITELGQFTENWDSYSAPGPNTISIRNARRVLDLIDLANLVPSRILPSAEGGIGLCFVRGDKYADIECSNEGEILGVYYTGKEMPRLLETDCTDSSIRSALEQISEYVFS